MPIAVAIVVAPAITGFRPENASPDVSGFVPGFVSGVAATIRVATRYAISDTDGLGNPHQTPRFSVLDDFLGKTGCRAG